MAVNEKNATNPPLWPSLIKLVNVNFLALTHLMPPRDTNHIPAMGRESDKGYVRCILSALASQTRF
jgi:hypothetical protein